MVITKNYKCMKRIILLSVFSVLFVSLFGQTQAEMNTKAKTEYEKVDKDLNQVYQKILQDYKSDTIFIKSMKEAQRQWVKFRDAQIKMKYPPYKDAGESVLPMCRNYYLKELTTNRIKELKQWIDGVEEGDVCSGSIKFKGQ
jgi:uncharacterized protein YecT (DUF1311 family)